MNILIFVSQFDYINLMEMTLKKNIEDIDGMPLTNPKHDN